MATLNFEQLEVYRASREFKGRIYKLASLFPEEERYRLRLQMRKAALSMTNCIAEGHGRFTWKDRIHFMRESRGSLNELEHFSCGRGVMTCAGSESQSPALPCGAPKRYGRVKNALVDDINDVEDNGYAKPEHLRDLKEDADRVHQLMNGYIAYIERQAKQRKNVARNSR
ncbi:MAG: four helix bundle protein [Phycisphaerales bacterium]|nr:four helix bundle protein [Phycisphaerales bacterium]